MLLTSNSKNEEPANIFRGFIIIAVTLSIFGGRWISYIGFPSFNLYIVDILFFSGVAGSVLTCRQRFKLERSQFSLCIILMTYLFILLLWPSQYSLKLRIRDLSPFIYLLATPIIYKTFTIGSWRSAIKSFRWAAVLCTTWSNAVMFKILTPITTGIPLFTLPIFSPRWDHSGMIACIGVVLWKNLRLFSLTGNDAIRIYLILSIFVQYSRASLLALIALIILSLAAKDLRSNEKKKEKVIYKLIFIFTLLALFSPYLNFSLATQSAFERFGLSKSTSLTEVFQHNLSAGTSQGRIKAQTALIAWTVDKNYLFFGAGPGSEMLLESGAYNFLSGAYDVRSPHSWPVSNFSRFGVFGFTLWHLFFYSFAMAKLHNSRITFASTVCLTIYVVSLFGVIIESPFGALPLSFFLAYNSNIMKKHLT